MRRSSLLAAGFLGALSVSAVLLSTRAAESRTQRTLHRAELYEVLGGFIDDYCCADNSLCAAMSQDCSDKNGTDAETCGTYQAIGVASGNRNSCSQYAPGVTCTNTGTYVCTAVYSCTWTASTMECARATLQAEFNAPQSCSSGACP